MREPSKPSTVPLMLARAQFLAALSHELRTPLNSIVGFTEVLRAGLDGALTPSQEESVEAIASASEYLVSLVRELLDTSAETTGELELFGYIDLDRIARDAALFFSPQARKSGHELLVSIDPRVPRPLGSPRAARQVLLNLIGNATKHGRPGPVRIFARLDEDVVALGVTNQSERLLRPSDVPIEAFERGTDEGRASKPDGWGLGLAIADELASRMGGVIEMESELGPDGPEVTFSLVLPVGRGGVCRRSRTSSQVMPTRTHFVAAMSHELRAPLGSIAGFASLLESGVDGPLTPAQLQSVTRIRRSAESLVASLGDILDVARVDVGRIHLTPAPVHAATFIGELVRGAAHLVEDRESPCALRVERSNLCDDEPLVFDRRRILQAALGLVRHALRAGDPPGIDLVFRTLEADAHHPAMLRLEVRDPSQSVDPDEAQAAFEHFGQLVDPTGRRILGLGLAPALARTFARMHGGDAYVETQRGTTWVLTVPVLASDAGSRR